MIKLLVAICLLYWHSGLLAADKADIPLTETPPESQGLDGLRLQQAIDGVEAGEYGDINALLVLRNDYLVLEHYFEPLYKGPDYRHPVRSVTKSFTSALSASRANRASCPICRPDCSTCFRSTATSKIWMVANER